MNSKTSPKKTAPPDAPSAAKKPNVLVNDSTPLQKARRGRCAKARVDVYISDNYTGILYDQSIEFRGGMPEVDDVVFLRNKKRFIVTAKHWVEGQDGVFRLALTLTPDKLKVGTGDPGG